MRHRAGPTGLPIGDDAALLDHSGPLAVSVDHQIAGTHFPPDLDPATVARRLAAVNLSDLAAVGARPRFAFLALAAPAGYDLRRFLNALVGECRRHRFVLAGGDLARSDRVGASLTLLGERPARGRWLRRENGRAGDRLWLGGTVGESAAGRRLLELGAAIRGRAVDLPARFARPRWLAAAARRAVRRHLRPTPQLGLGQWLAGRLRAAAIDLSDGLALDLHRLCEASGVGACLEADELPLAPRFGDLADRRGADPVTLALAGGEDYVLLFALPRRVRPPSRWNCRPVGTLTAEPRIVLARAGDSQPLPASGWDHLASP